MSVTLSPAALERAKVSQLFVTVTLTHPMGCLPLRPVARHVAWVPTAAEGFSTAVQIQDAMGEVVASYPIDVHLIVPTDELYLHLGDIVAQGSVQIETMSPGWKPAWASHG